MLLGQLLESRTRGCSRPRRGPGRGEGRAPRFAVLGVGAGAVLKVKAANLELGKDRVLDPAMATLVTAMQALAPGAPPPELRRWRPGGTWRSGGGAGARARGRGAGGGGRT